MNQSKNQYATKKDLAATRRELLDKIESIKKELLSKLASKDELKLEVAKLASKKDLAKVINRLDKVEYNVELLTNQVAINTQDIQETHKRLDKVEYNLEIVANQVANNTEEIKETHRKLDMLLEAMDGVMSEINISRAERAATDHALRRHETRLENHETRIQFLEDKRQI